VPSLFDKGNPEGIYPALEELETRLCLPMGFCEGLRREDDWSFIIKLHALLEAALTALLAAKIGQELHATFARLAAAAVFEIEASRSFSSVSIARRASVRLCGPR